MSEFLRCCRDSSAPRLRSTPIDLAQFALGGFRRHRDSDAPSPGLQTGLIQLAARTHAPTWERGPQALHSGGRAALGPRTSSMMAACGLARGGLLRACSRTHTAAIRTHLSIFFIRASIRSSTSPPSPRSRAPRSIT